MLKNTLLIVAITLVTGLAVEQANADTWVNGYYRSNGTYVQPHYRSSADGNFSNNWSTYPNVNPYTGKIGTRITPSHNNFPSYGGYQGKSGYGSSSSYRSPWAR